MNYKLTKENYFDQALKSFPGAMAQFRSWIDNYKVDNNFNQLFNSGFICTDGKETEAPKYHDLPPAMQMGIFIEWARQRGGCEYEVDIFEFDLSIDFTGMLNMLQFEHEMDGGHDTLMMDLEALLKLAQTTMYCLGKFSPNFSEVNKQICWADADGTKIMISEKNLVKFIQDTGVLNRLEPSILTMLKLEYDPGVSEKTIIEFNLYKDRNGSIASVMTFDDGKIQLDMETNTVDISDIVEQKHICTVDQIKDGQKVSIIPGDKFLEHGPQNPGVYFGDVRVANEITETGQKYIREVGKTIEEYFTGEKPQTPMLSRALNQSNPDQTSLFDVHYESYFMPSWQVMKNILYLDDEFQGSFRQFDMTKQDQRILFFRELYGIKPLIGFVDHTMPAYKGFVESLRIAVNQLLANVQEIATIEGMTQKFWWKKNQLIINRADYEYALYRLSLVEGMNKGEPGFNEYQDLIIRIAQWESENETITLSNKFNDGK